MSKQHPPRRTPRGVPPACPLCGAALPHETPMARLWHRQQQEKVWYDECVARARTLGRPFEDWEVFDPVWQEGVELVPQSDYLGRFELAQEATGAQRRLWRLTETG